MKTHSGKRDTALLFLSPRRYVGVMVAFLPQKETRHPLDRRVGGLQGRYEWVRKISHPPNWIRSMDRPARSELLYGLKAVFNTYCVRFIMVYPSTDVICLASMIHCLTRPNQMLKKFSHSSHIVILRVFMVPASQVGAPAMLLLIVKSEK